MQSLVEWLPYLALPATVGSGLMAGLLFVFSNAIMRALTQLPPAAGLEAMQRINVAIVNPLFLTVFLGTTRAVVRDRRHHRRRARSWLAVRGQPRRISSASSGSPWPATSR